MEPTRDQAYATPISYRDECIAVAIKTHCAGSGDWLYLRSYPLTSAKIKVLSARKLRFRMEKCTRNGQLRNLDA